MNTQGAIFKHLHLMSVKQSGKLSSKFIVGWLAIACCVASGAGHANAWVSSRSVTLRGELRHERKESALGVASSKKFVERVGSLEAQGNGKWKPTDEFTGGADLSAFYLVDSAAKDRWKIVTSEAYLQWELPSAFSLLTGKKRMSWGSGIAQNPLDFLNPRKNPLDPTLQREGAWIAQVEYPAEGYTLSLLAAAEMLETEHGVWKKLDLERRAFAARAYFLLGGTDLTVAAYQTYLYQNSFRHKPSLGLSLSRLVTSATELHFEGLVRQGSTRSFVNASCVQSQTSALQCARSGISPVSESKRTAKKVFPQLVFGTRTQYSDDSLFALEVLYWGDGDSKIEYQNKLRLLERSQQDLPGVALGADQGLQRRWFFSANYQRWKVLEDLFLSSSVLLNLHDLSGIVSPQCNWTPQDWLSFTAGGEVNFAPSAKVFRPKYAGVRNRSSAEFQLTPADALVRLEAKAYF